MCDLWCKNPTPSPWASRQNLRGHLQETPLSSDDVSHTAAAHADESPEERRERYRVLVTAQREALKARLYRERENDLAMKLEKCGQETSLTCTNCGDHHPIETRCKRRWCPSCSRSISAERTRRYERRLQNMTWPLWVTLTIKNRLDLEVVDEIKAGWRAFRRRKIYTSHTKGGLAALEVTERGNGWHPHMHAMLDCKWLAHDTPPPHPHDTASIVAEKIESAKAELATTWGECIGQEIGIALAVRKNGSQAIRELLKYAVKGSDLLETALPIGDLIRCIDSGRTISTFGSLRNGKLPPDPEDDKPGLACTQCEEEGCWLPSEIVSRYTGTPVPRMVKFESGPGK